MKRSNLPWQLCSTAELDWSNPEAPRSVQFGDAYYSFADGIDESLYVFLTGNRLKERLSNHDRDVFCILETGFGTGLNFLLSFAAWQAIPQPKPRLHYIAIEKYPLHQTDLQRALANWPTLAEQAQQLLQHYPHPVPGQHRIGLDNGQLTLDLWFEDVSDAITDIAGSGQRPVDAWYLDGFTPARNESMWDSPLFSAMAGASRAGATFSTFTAAGHVRRKLQTAGFEVETADGFGPKKACLRGQLIGQPNLPRTDTPWETGYASSGSPTSALVVGAGLAGCTIAAALAERGIRVTVLEQGQVASAGSGNNQGILYTRLSARHSALSDFALQSFMFAARYYRQLFTAGRLVSGRDGELCGSFHHSSRQAEMDTLSTVLANTPALAAVLSAARASELLGVTQNSDGYWFPESGWLRPASICRTLLDHPGITLIEDCGAIELARHNGNWVASHGACQLTQAPCAIIATGTSATDQLPLSWLPLQAIRGQTTELPGNPEFEKLRAGVCHSGYIAPARDGLHCIGATFDLDDTDQSIRLEDHRYNLAALAAAIPQWQPLLDSVDPASLSGRVGFRCATPDYLPIAGPVPDYDGFLQTYRGLRKNAKRAIPVPGPYIDGLYVSTGHGSRGLTSTPLAAELIAATICNEALPLSTELHRAVSPGRFIIRDISRGLI
ncbi:MAG: bifunctional tRNA (5-methylaminomethyl-2-thiouridine)(34)-methyltransferase MnmD/FAD-dependent 5-carboxymethylaminomethyl-2-thiouridine(34) oxidoreductase MnmC [Halioglobus sp.]